MKSTKKLLALLLSVMFLAGVLAGCGGKTKPEKTEPEGGETVAVSTDTFVVALDSDIVGLDPAQAYDFTTNPVLNQITQSLLTFDTDNQLQPLLAESWEQVDDLTYTYQIRSDVVFSMQRIMDDESAYMNWMYASVEKIEATGDWEVTVSLSVPDATWQYVPATTAAHVLKKDFVEEAGDAFGQPDAGVIGTGPYVFVSYKSGDQAVLAANENYWGEDKAHFENLIFKIITEDTTRVAALESGDVQAIIPAPASMMERLAEDENVTLSTVSGFAVTFVAFNTEKEPFNDVKVRQAIAMAVDMEGIHENLIGSIGDAPTVLPSSAALFGEEEDRWQEYLDANPLPAYDVEAAKALLEEAGYADGFTCTLMVSEDTVRNNIALAIQQNLAEIGITVEIERVNNDLHTAYQFGEADTLDADGLRGYDMLMAGWEADFPDPSGNLLPLYQGGNSSNSAAYNNEEVTKLINDQLAESDLTARNDMMFQALDIAIDETAYLFPFYPVKSIAMNSAYEGIIMSASWIWNIHLQDVKPSA